MEKSKINLCDTCHYHPATCTADKIDYGNGKGNDNVIRCNAYRLLLPGEKRKRIGAIGAAQVVKSVEKINKPRP